MTVRLAIVAEGTTEKNFAEKVLRVHLPEVWAVHAVNINGNVSIDRLATHINRLVRNFHYVTTMVDYYGFRNRGQKTASDIESEIRERFGDQRGKVIPYLQKHEFEALLFSDCTAIAKHLRLSGEQTRKLNNSNVPPEDINHDCPPAKLIAQIHPRYKKVLDGVEIARQIGISTIMEKCPKFAEWVQKLEGLGK